MKQSLDSASGVVLVSGPAGSGKTTTAYAVLQKLAQADSTIRRCLVSLEDPIEQVIEGVSQSQIQPNVGFDWASGLKAILRQDPEVMLIGEIRDAETARIVFQAAATGQLVVSTMHARSVADAVTRLDTPVLRSFNPRSLSRANEAVSISPLCVMVKGGGFANHRFEMLTFRPYTSVKT